MNDLSGKRKANGSLKKEEKGEYEQLSVYDAIFKLAQRLGKSSSSDIDKLLNEITAAKKSALQREKEERERKEAEERERLLEKEREEEKQRIKNATSMDLPLDFENAFSRDEEAKKVRVDSPQDGLIASIGNLGRVDIEYISEISGCDLKTVIESLKGSIYQNPDTWGECFYKGWESADEYLSGNLIKKWRAARAASRTYNGWFDRNVAAIDKILPARARAEDIFVTLGSPWVPSDVIDEFIEYLLGSSWASGLSSCAVIHDEITGTWEIPSKTRYDGSALSYKRYGTRRIGALYIIEKMLNLKTVVVKDEVVCKTSASGVRREINKEETALAIEKQNLIEKEFKEWVWREATRKNRLIDIYQDKYVYKTRRYDGAFLTFPGISPSATLYQYQKNAVARMLFNKNVLLANDVGSGKTYEMIAAAMELRRMRIAEKHLFAVPSSVVEQWRKVFAELYPNARVKVVTPQSFTPSKRQDVLKDIRDNDYDGIIMTHSSLDLIPVSSSFRAKELKKRKEELKATKQTPATKNAIKSIDKELKKLSQSGASKGISFDELKIDRLYVDEAHEYKNLPIKTNLDSVLGISANGSKKCADMMDKVVSVQKRGGGVIFATGTPITNSLTDAYVMQKYLQGGELALLDLQSFDAWVGMFAERSTEFEIDVDTSGYRLATRFRKFHNLNELTALLSQIADFHSVAKDDGLPKTDGYVDVIVKKTPEFADFLYDISRRADAVRKGAVSRATDNMLAITNDGRKAALDLRIVDTNANFTVESKVYKCAEIVADIYFKTAIKRSVQLVFCDVSTPKPTFNEYDELKRILINFGVSASEIAFIHDAATDKKREELFKSVRRGEVRVLIGSTFKVGMGVNVQNKLIALHHLDVPWRPADMVQREGRIIRRGNENEKVNIFRYVTEGSFDAYSWQLLETKQAFISSVLSGSLEENDGDDIADTVLNYAEVKALAVGNPLVKKRVEAANELSRLKSLQAKAVEERMKLEQEAVTLPKEAEETARLIKTCREDAVFASATVAEWDKVRRKALRERVFGELQKNELQKSERTLLKYRGFDVILPADMLKESPYVILKRAGRYTVDIGKSDLGVATRLDNVIDDLSGRLMKLESKLKEINARKLSVDAELMRSESYAEEISAAKKTLNELDLKLGIKNE